MTEQSFNSFCDASFAQLLSLAPEVAGEIGVTEINGTRIPQNKFSDYTQSGQNQRMSAMKDTLAKLEAYDRASLSDDEKMTFDIYRDFLYNGRFGSLLGVNFAPTLGAEPLLNHLTGIQAEALTFLTEWHSFHDQQSIKDHLQKLSQVPQLIEATIDWLDNQKAQERLIATNILDRVCSETRAFLAIDPAQSEILTTFTDGLATLNVTGAEAAALRDEALTLIKTAVYPAYQTLLTYLQDNYPHTENRIGLARLDDGKAHYRQCLAAATTTALTPEQVHEQGLTELAALQSAIEVELDALGYTADSFAKKLETFEQDPALNLPAGETREQIMARVQTIMDDVRAPFLETLGRKPKADVVIQAIPEHQEGNRHSLYTPPADDGSRPGVFYINLTHLRGSSANSLYTLTYHETFPGHHVQLTIAQELGDDLPALRRILVHASYIEGWAKYSETLPWREGYNKNRHWHVSRMRSELISTANLALDTGIHYFGWTRDQGIKFVIEETASSRAFAEMIVDRISATPAQTCAYKIGMNTVIGLRDRAEQTQGADFDIKRFHDLILDSGSMPLTLLSDHVLGSLDIGR